MDRNYDAITCFSKKYILRRPEVVIFAGIMKSPTIFVKTILKYSKKVKRIRNYVSKWNLYLYFLIKQNLQIFGEKMLISPKLKGVSRDSYISWVSFG